MRQAITAWDWFATIILKDAYIQIPIWQGHWRFLRFGFEGSIFEFWLLPFEISLAPQTSTQYMDVVLEPMRQQGLRILSYLNHKFPEGQHIVYSLKNDNLPVDWDALAHSWPQGLFYTFLPFILLQHLL